MKVNHLDWALAGMVLSIIGGVLCIALMLSGCTTPEVQKIYSTENCDWCSMKGDLDGQNKTNP